jgi:WD40 repeat protein
MFLPLSLMCSQVVTVWEYARKQLSIKQCLYGHTDAVTCLAASPAYNVIVSGSRDATAIIWDLSRRIFVRQLQGHAAPVAAVAVNELTVSCFMPRAHKLLTDNKEQDLIYIHEICYWCPLLNIIDGPQFWCLLVSLHYYFT